MQENNQNISPIKQRILSYIDKNYKSKREFYAESGISRGTLESHTGITEDVLAKFFATCPEASVYWIVTGKTNEEIKYKEIEYPPDLSAADHFSEYNTYNNDLLKLIREKDLTIQEMCEQIGSMREQLRNLKKYECSLPECPFPLPKLNK